MAKQPSFLFYYGEWLSSPRVRSLTPALRGAFIDLLAFCYSGPQASISSNNDELKGMSGLSDEQWQNGGKQMVAKFFVEHPEIKGSLTNPKLYVIWKADKNIQKTQSKSIKNVMFSPPNVEEVAIYCAERSNKVDAQAFVDFYISKNWMIGKSKMKDWRAAVRTWERNGYGNGNGQKYNGQSKTTERPGGTPVADSW